MPKQTDMKTMELFGDHGMKQQAFIKHSRYGFTLIELIIALSMLSILTAYAIPNYRAFKQNKTMTAEVNRLVATINYARNKSIMLQEHVILCATNSYVSCDGNSQWHVGWMVFVDHDRNRQYGADDLMLQNEMSMANGLAAKASNGRPLIRFDQTGFAPGTNLSIRFCDQRGAEFGKAIVVSNAGRPRLAQSINRCE